MKGLSVGYSRVEMTPPLPFPLAGNVTRRERLASWVKDPVCATCLAFSPGDRPVALLVLDLLIIPQSLRERLATIALEVGYAGLYVMASHSHAAPGGFIEGWGAQWFMGRHRPELVRHLEDRVKAALEGAAGDLSEAETLRFGRATVPGLTMNRRRRNGPTDDRLSVVEVRRRRASPVLLLGVSGHPVIVSEMAPDAASADYPGLVVKGLAAEGFSPVVLPGALGGLNILFPEMRTNVDDHLNLLATLILAGTRRALAGATTAGDLSLSLREEELEFRLAPPPRTGGPLPTALKSWLTSSFGHLYAGRTAPAVTTVPVGLLRLGPVALAGMPADFGVGATLQLRDRLEAAGCACPIVTSHTNGYLGYLHMHEEHAWHKDAQPEFLHYENAMSWYGDDACERVMEAAVRLYGGT
jgi:hypothetical protein